MDINRLIRENKEGYLGKSLAKALKGSLGHLQPRRDSDFLILFPSAKEMPTTEDIEKESCAYFRKLGLRPEKITRKKDYFEAVFPFDKDAVLLLQLSNNYPHNESRLALRVTTTLIV